MVLDVEIIENEEKMKNNHADYGESTEEVEGGEAIAC